jgi:hypothetical protein
VLVSHQVRGEQVVDAALIEVRTYPAPFATGEEDKGHPSALAVDGATTEFRRRRARQDATSTFPIDPRESAAGQLPPVVFRR